MLHAQIRLKRSLGEPTCCRSNMASEASPPGEQVKRSSRRQQKKTGEVEDRTWAGHRALQAGRPQDALRYFKQALQAATQVSQLQDSRVLRACSFNLGAAYVEAGRPGTGLDLLRRNRPGPKAERLPDLQFNTALAHNALGQYQEAAAHFLRAAQLYRSQGDGGSEGDACMELGRCCSRTQVRTGTEPPEYQDWDWPQAVQSFLRAAESYKMASMLDSAAAALKEAGSHLVQSDLSNHDDISRVLTECLSLSSSVSDSSILGELYLSVGVAYCRIRCFQEAVSCLRRALEPAAHRPRLLAKVQHNLGAALNAAGDFSSAVAHHRLAARLYGSQGCRGDQARCFSNLAIACSHLGDEQEAAESFILALQGFRDTGDRLAEAQVCEHLAECYLRQKKLQKAVELYKQALSALSHCKIVVTNRWCCSQEAEGVQDRLVERLTAALQLSLTATQRPRPHRPHPHPPQPHSSPGHQDVRKLDVTQHLAANQHLDEQWAESNKGAEGEKSSSRQAAADPEGGVTPGRHLSEPAEELQQGELWLDRANPHTDSEASSPEQAEPPPSSSVD
ncbi:tetratricopeptide repeat protein 24 isoform X2 [Gambusia affinis]|uniref:tetratricopeptide repeat protein 24 isoform X2 n=1 Tax=Gambusia affinis TaxID=33528 RepID=UPI001CDCD97A|nr:tetratricopeptide repeat protein 24 isoform X2 [Gambusia affinis]